MRLSVLLASTVLHFLQQYRYVPKIGFPAAILMDTSIFLLSSSAVRWRHIIRNFTIRNRDPHRSILLNFLLRVKDLVNSDCRFGFLVKICIYSRLEMCRILNSEPKIRNFKTLVPKNAISYRMSPP